MSLWQVKEWTGVSVDCFVNYLRLPDAGDETLKAESALEPIDDVRLQERASVVQPGETSDFAMPRELNGLQKLDAYQVSLADSIIARHWLTSLTGIA